MKIDYKKLIWVLVSCLMALSLIIASCDTQETATVEEKDEGPVEVVITETEEGYEVKTTVQEGYRDPNEPKYGGTMTFAWFEPQGWDPYYTFMVSCSTIYLVNEEMLMGDWTKTPAGDGSAGIHGFLGYASRLTGGLAESWSMPDNETLLYTIRQGVYWQDKDPVNGREYDAYDGAWAINRLTSAPTGAHRMMSPPEEYILGATALDKWTVEVKVPPEALGVQAVYVGAWLHQYPKEVVDSYGDMKDWRNVVGTGPYILKDYVTGSVLTFERNPNYWQHDPIHPENQLPYLDRCKWMIVNDASTQLAGFRTGQIDISYGLAINTEDSRMLIEQNPEMHHVSLPIGVEPHLYFRVDKPELPWKDTRVRQAMTLTINKQELIDDYYSGNADLLGAVYPPDKAWEPFYTPLEEQPTEPTTEDSRCGVQELFTFDETTIPKAKALLTEAGYPNGFKCQIISSSPAQTDFLSIIKEYFAAVNVELEIQQLEGSIVGGMRRARSYEEGIYTGSPTAWYPYSMHNVRKESFDCFSYYEHPKTRAAYEEQRKYAMRDDAKYAAVLKEITPFILEQCVGIWCPLPRSFRMWWPWVQNYHGEDGLGCDDQLIMYWYMWMDEEMKQGMGY